MWFKHFGFIDNMLLYLFAFRYPDDPELTFETLPAKSFKTVELWGKSEQKAKDTLEHILFILTSSYELGEALYQFSDDTVKCDAIPDSIPIPFGSIPNP